MKTIAIKRSWIKNFIIIVLLALMGSILLQCSNKTGDELRIQDLKEINKALAKYYKDNNAYPVSNTWAGWKCAFGESKEDWIPGLVPKYISKLPRDPRKDATGYQQYIYYSNGKDYKLISHAPENCNKIKSEYVELIDPRRDDPRNQCTAFGFWSEGGRNF